jgi:hypothetical protein
MQATPLQQLLDEAGNVTNLYAWGTWESPNIPPHETDSVYVSTDNDLGRIDLISHKFYGTPDFFWVILLVNDIMDQFSDDAEQLGLAPGTVLRIPAKSRVTAILEGGATVSSSSIQQ